MSVRGGTRSVGSEVGKDSPKTPPSPESSHSGDTSSLVSPHYDTSKDIVLRAEFLTAQQMKASHWAGPAQAQPGPYVYPAYERCRKLPLGLNTPLELSLQAVVLSVWGAVLVGLGLLALGLDFKLNKVHQHLLPARLFFGSPGLQQQHGQPTAAMWDADFTILCTCQSHGRVTWGQTRQSAVGSGAWSKPWLHKAQPEGAVAAVSEVGRSTRRPGQRQLVSCFLWPSVGVAAATATPFMLCRTRSTLCMTGQSLR